MQRATVGVDVASVGIGVQEVGVDVAVLEDHGRDGAGGAVGAIDQHTQLAEAARSDERGQPFGVLRAQRSFAGQHIVAGVVGLRRACRQLLDVGEDVGLDGVFQFVGEFVAVSAEDLDAVIVPGIVRGGDDDAGRIAGGPHQVGNAGGRNDARAGNLHAGGFQAGSEHLADPRAGLARVLTDDDASAGRALGEALSEGASDGIHGFVVERVFAGDAANPVGAEKLSLEGWCLRRTQGLAAPVDCLPVVTVT